MSWLRSMSGLTRYLRRGTVVMITPVLGVGSYLVPVTAAVAGAAAITAVSAAVGAAPARACRLDEFVVA